MSLIFNALKKLKSEPQQADGETSSELHQRSNVYTFGRIFSSPLVILLLFIAGLAVYYGCLLLFSYFPLGTSLSKTQPATHQPSQRVPVPQPNKETDTTPEKLAIPDRPEFLPTAELRQPDRQPNPLLPRQAAKAAFPDDEGGVQYIGRGALPESEGKTSENNNPTGPAGHLETAADNPDHGGSVPAEKPATHPEDTENRKEKQNQIKIERSRTMAMLVSDMEASINARDFQKAGRLLKKLRKNAKTDSPYLLKLESYLCFRTGKPDMAEQLLKQVLAKNQYDLEANINMAAVEIQKGRKQEAFLRLKKLSKIYPDNDTVQKLFRKLN